MFVDPEGLAIEVFLPGGIPVTPLLWGIFGVDMNVWLDAFLRLQIVVAS